MDIIITLILVMGFIGLVGFDFVNEKWLKKERAQRKLQWLMDNKDKLSEKEYQFLLKQISKDLEG